jgi:hypothetical protein
VEFKYRSGERRICAESQNRSGDTGTGRKVIGEAGDFELREFSAPYISPFEPENEDIGVNNAIFGNI